MAKPKPWHRELLGIANRLNDSGLLIKDVTGSNYRYWVQRAEDEPTLQIYNAEVRAGRNGRLAVKRAIFSVESDGVAASVVAEKDWRLKDWPEQDEFCQFIVDSFRTYAEWISKLPDQP